MDRGNPQVGFEEASDKMLLFFFWLITGSQAELEALRKATKQ